MKHSLLLLPFYSVWAEENHPPAVEAANPFSGGADPFTTIVLVILLILIVWFLLRVQSSQVDTSDLEHGDHGHDAHGHTAHQAEATPTMAPPVASAGPDDLRKIEGIGPKVESLLNNAGINTFAQLADTAVDKIQSILDEAGYQYMNPGTSPEQARLAAGGNWEALQKLQDELNAGRS